MASFPQLFAFIPISGDNVNVCEIAGVKHASVLDVIAEMCGGQTKKIWTMLQKRYPGEFACKTYDFPGQIASPVADVQTMVRIIMVLPGSKASAYLHKTTEIVMQQTGGRFEAIFNNLFGNAS